MEFAAAHLFLPELGGASSRFFRRAAQLTFAFDYRQARLRRVSRRVDFDRRVWGSGILGRDAHRLAGRRENHAGRL